MAHRAEANRPRRRRRPAAEPAANPEPAAGPENGDTDDVTNDRTRKIFTLRKQIETGEYTIDAEHIARRLRDEL